MAIRMRIGTEDKFDAKKMVPGEWAVSKDTKYVRMCFAPGVVARMATYEGFEQDMKEIQLILATCQDIEVAVERFTQLAEQHASQAEVWSDTSKSWAVGGTGTREGEDTNNSKFFSDLAKTLTDEAQKLLEQAQKIVAAATQGALIPAGTVAFKDLPVNPVVGYLYNISSDFTTDSRFVEGAGVFYRAGANVYWTKDGKWDVMIGTQVTGVKGNLEDSYRVGNVNLTPQNIGALSLSGGTVSGIITSKNETTGVGSYFRAKKSNVDIMYGVSSNEAKRGIFDATLNEWVVDITDDESKFRGTADQAEKVENALTFAGAVNETYDGSTEKTVHIPSGVTNLLATETGHWLDATMGKQLKDELDSQNLSFAKSIGDLSNDLSNLNTSLSNINNKFLLKNIAIQASSIYSNEYIDLEFIQTSTQKYLFRIYIHTCRLSMYESKDNGKSYTTLWDKILS